MDSYDSESRRILHHLSRSTRSALFCTATVQQKSRRSFVNFEESSHSTEYYKDGTKFKITKINTDKKCFRIEGREKLNLNKNVIFFVFILKCEMSSYISRAIT